MQTETEIKIRLTNAEFQEVLSLCRSSFTEDAPATQVDEYYDTPQEALRAQDYTVRFRISNSGKKLALKSPRVFLDDTVHSRIELEFSIHDEDELRKELEGLSCVARIEKERWTFHEGENAIAIDRLPFIGEFLEIEGKNANDIGKVLGLLKLPRDTATSLNYTELLEAEAARLGLPIRPHLEATFEKEKEMLEKSGVVQD